jgi:hypothetical protein
LPYIGGDNAKEDQATNAEGYLTNETVDIIGYSGGTEPALMYGLWRTENNQEVSSIVLLGPTFETAEIKFNEPDGGWSEILDNLLKKGVNIYVIDDGAPWNLNEGATYDPPTDATGEWKYEYVPQKHFSEHPNWDWGTNDNKGLKKSVYSWMNRKRNTIQ